MTTQAPLTAPQRGEILASVYRALSEAAPELFQGPQMVLRPGGPLELPARLDAMVEIVRRTTADRVEPYIAQMLDGICAHCPRQQTSGFCPLRYDKSCVLFRCAGPIVKAIGQALWEMDDPEYLANHPYHRGDQ